VIDLLSELTYNMKNYKKALKYINLFLAWKPRNVDKLFMKWKSLRELWNKKEASLVYKRILDLQPYNSKAKENYEKYKDKKELIDL
jgi:tetratricopeptide (TPR) repeat protein